MAQDVMTQIREAEAKAEQMMAEAATEAKAIIEEEQNKARANAEKIIGEAREAAKAVIADAEGKSAESVALKEKGNEAVMADLRSIAAKNNEKAVSFIVEAMVN